MMQYGRPIWGSHSLAERDFPLSSYHREVIQALCPGVRVMASSEQHKDLIRAEFTKQAVAYATNASIADPSRIVRLVEAVGPSPRSRVLEVATGPGHVAL